MKRKGAGRPSKYDTHVKDRLNEVRAWRQDGHTEEQIAHLLGIHYGTLMEYKKQYAEFNEALKESKEALISNLKQTLFQEAMGTRSSQDIIEETQEYDYRLNKMVTVKKVVRYSNKPNITSLIFALKNLDPNNWKDRRDINVDSENVLEKAAENFELFMNQLKESLDDENEN